MKLYYVTNIFDLHTFDNETTAFLKTFEISTEMDFISLFFLNERNITTSLPILHLKCTALHCANLNSSSINKPSLRVVEYAIFFFEFLFTLILTTFLSKTLWKKLSFLIQISKIHFKMSYITQYKDIKTCDTKMADLWI